MVKIRTDLDAVVVVVSESGAPVVLAPGDEVPVGVSVGEHAVEAGNRAPSRKSPR